MIGLAEFVTSKARRTTVKELCELRRNEVKFDSTCALRVKSRLTRPLDKYVQHMYDYTRNQALTRGVGA